MELKAYQIINSRGVPTLEVAALFDNTLITASVPQGASKSTHEIKYLIDKNTKFNGLSVYKAVFELNDYLLPMLKSKLGKIPQDQFDNIIKELSPWGNIRLVLSLLHLKLTSFFSGTPLFKTIEVLTNTKAYLPTPMFNVINGGAHANNNIQIQEFMIVPTGIEFYPKQLEAGVEIFMQLKKLLKEKKLNTGVGDEGGFAPKLKNDKQALDLLMLAIKRAGYKPQEQIHIALDVAVSIYYKNNKYHLKHLTGTNEISAKNLIQFYKELADKYPILSIEDGVAENDWANWPNLTTTLMRKNILSVGDDLISTNPKLMTKAIKDNAISAVIIKPNQVGTLTETFEVIKMAQQNGITCIASHRSGETNDPTIAHIATGSAVSFIKSGAPNRGERVNKYNELLRIHHLYGIN